MSHISAEEIGREYRVLRQTLSMHSDLRDEFSRKARLAEILILICSAFLCSVTFAGAEFYQALAMDPGRGRILTGLAGVAAFASSLALLVLGWNRRAAEHTEEAKRWSAVLQRFRSTQLEDHSWPEVIREELSDLYWQTDKYSVGIPGRRFTDLKGRYLRKVLMSRLKSRFPGAPRLVIWLVVRMRHTSALIRNAERTLERE